MFFLIKPNSIFMYQRPPIRRKLYLAKDTF